MNEKPAENTMKSAGLLAQGLQTLGPLAALLVVIVLFAICDAKFGGGQFATIRNARTVTIQSCTIAMAALGMTVIIISGGIDLSCGTAIALSATVLAWGLREDVGCMIAHQENYSTAAKRLEDAERDFAKAADAEQRAAQDQRRVTARQQVSAILQDKIATFAVDRDTNQSLSAHLHHLQMSAEQGSGVIFRAAAGVPNAPSTVWISLILAIITGILCGMLNGFLVSSLRVVPFIVTLGTMTIYLGGGNLLSNNVPIRPSLKYQVPDWLEGVLSNSERNFWLGFPSGVWLTIIAALVVAALLRYTVFGRYVFALGSNEQTARLCGINVSANKIAVYTLGGMLMGLAGVLQFSRLSSGNPMSGRGLELQIIAAVVIGGGSLNGGRGTILGTLAGAGIMAVIISGGTQLGMSNALQDILLGVVIISAVSIDQLRQRLAK